MGHFKSNWKESNWYQGGIDFSLVINFPDVTNYSYVIDYSYIINTKMTKNLVLHKLIFENIILDHTNPCCIELYLKRLREKPLAKEMNATELR